MVNLDHQIGQKSSETVKWNNSEILLDKKKKNNSKKIDSSQTDRHLKPEVDDSSGYLRINISATCFLVQANDYVDLWSLFYWRYVHYLQCTYTRKRYTLEATPPDPPPPSASRLRRNALFHPDWTIWIPSKKVRANIPIFKRATVRTPG